MTLMMLIGEWYETLQRFPVCTCYINYFLLLYGVSCLMVFLVLYNCGVSCLRVVLVLYNLWGERGSTLEDVCWLSLAGLRRMLERKWTQQEGKKQA